MLGDCPQVRREYADLEILAFASIITQMQRVMDCERIKATDKLIKHVACDTIRIRTRTDMHSATMLMRHADDFKYTP